MSDPLRADPLHGVLSPSIDGDAERDAKIESLLLGGLDHYFASDYAQAIDVWTRALFLDRQHPRARAYIERARSALAEQQRESDELLHNGVAAFERGEIEAARQLLNLAVQRGGAHDVALAFLTRIDRINAAAPVSSAPAAVPPPAPPRAGVAPVRPHHSSWLSPAAVLAILLAIVALTAISGDRIRAVFLLLSADSEVGVAPVRTVQDPAVVPSSAEAALDRARALWASGRLHDALRAVDLVRNTDPLRADAERLKATIQRELLSHQTLPGGSGSGTP